MQFGWTVAVEFFSSVYHPQDVWDEKVSLILAHYEHGKRDGIATESQRNHDGFPTEFSSELCQGDIPSEFRRDSVDSMEFHGIDGITTEPGFLFLPVPSVLGSNWLFHLGRLGGDRLQKKIWPQKFIRSA